MDRIFWHNSLRDAVFSAAQTAALAPRKEVPSLILGSQNRPADVFLPCWKGGRPAVLDITVIYRQPSGLPLNALLVAEERNLSAHGAACQAAAFPLSPLPLKPSGA